VFFVGSFLDFSHTLLAFLVNIKLTYPKIEKRNQKNGKLFHFCFSRRKLQSATDEIWQGALLIYSLTIHSDVMIQIKRGVAREGKMNSYKCSDKYVCVCYHNQGKLTNNFRSGEVGIGRVNSKHGIVFFSDVFFE